jgi:hypothetical protein
MPHPARSVDDYLASLPEERRQVLQAVREVILRNLDPQIEEGLQYGMIGYAVPHRVYPAGYHCDPRQPLPFAALASQKNHMSLHLMCVYGAPELEAWFSAAWRKTGKKLDMGKACLRFRRLDDLALDVLGEAIRRVPANAFIAHYEATFRAPGGGRKGAAKAARPAASAKATPKRTTPKKAAPKKAAGARGPAPRARKAPPKR